MQSPEVALEPTTSDEASLLDNADMTWFTARPARNAPTEHAKGESDICAVRPALEFPNVELLTRAKARRLKTNASGDCITSVEVERN